MLSDPLRAFRARIAEASHRVGRNPGKIIDDLLDDVAPKTVTAARDEGFDHIFRLGAVAYARGVLSQVEEDDRQLDFDALCESFAAEIKPLGKGAYFVPSLGEFVPVGRMIAEPELLDEARKFTRQKGEETIAEADRLDALYEAVLAKIAT